MKQNIQKVTCMGEHVNIYCLLLYPVTLTDRSLPWGGQSRFTEIRSIKQSKPDPEVAIVQWISSAATSGGSRACRMIERDILLKARFEEFLTY